MSVSTLYMESLTPVKKLIPKPVNCAGIRFDPVACMYTSLFYDDLEEELARVFGTIFDDEWFVNLIPKLDEVSNSVRDHRGIFRVLPSVCASASSVLGNGWYRQLVEKVFKRNSSLKGKYYTLFLNIPSTMANENTGIAATTLKVTPGGINDYLDQLVIDYPEMRRDRMPEVMRDDYHHAQTCEQAVTVVEVARHSSNLVNNSHMVQMALCSLYLREYRHIQYTLLIKQLARFFARFVYHGVSVLGGSMAVNSVNVGHIFALRNSPPGSEAYDVYRNRLSSYITGSNLFGKTPMGDRYMLSRDEHLPDYVPW